MAESSGEAWRTTQLYVGSVKFSVFFVSRAAASLTMEEPAAAAQRSGRRGLCSQPVVGFKS